MTYLESTTQRFLHKWLQKLSVGKLRIAIMIALLPDCLVFCGYFKVVCFAGKKNNDLWAPILQSCDLLV